MFMLAPLCLTFFGISNVSLIFPICTDDMLIQYSRKLYIYAMYWYEIGLYRSILSICTYQFFPVLTFNYLLEYRIPLWQRRFSEFAERKCIARHAGRSRTKESKGM